MNVRVCGARELYIGSVVRNTIVIICNGMTTKPYMTRTNTKRIQCFMVTLLDGMHLLLCIQLQKFSSRSALDAICQIDGKKWFTP